MGTRGTWGFAVDGTELLTYNHFDSYPSGLGSDLLGFLRAVEDFDLLAAKAAAIRLVTEDDAPTAEDVERLRKFHNSGVSTGQLTEWYSLLRETQGDPAATLDAGVMIDGANFPLDSLFCEWAYVIDLDARRLEVYTGFQSAPHSEGRFAERGDFQSATGDSYYPVRLVASWPLDDLPDDETFERTCDPPEADDVA